MTSSPAQNLPTHLVRGLLILLGIVAIVVHQATGLSLGLLWLALFVGWPLVGTLITLDDDLPGGWSNPDGAAVPPWRDAAFGAQLVFGLAAAAIGFAHDGRWRTLREMLLLAVAVAFVAVAILLLRTARGDRAGAR